MKILVITSAQTFPSDGRPNAGIFFANLLKRLEVLVDKIMVVSPVAYVPSPLQHSRKFSKHRLIRAHQWWCGIEVFRPQFLSFSNNRHLWIHSRSFCRSSMRLCCSLHRGHRFDIVAGYGFGAPAHAAQCVAKALGLRCVSWAIGSDVNTVSGYSDENARLFRHNVRYTDLILTESDALRRAVIGACPWAKHVHTYYKGIDLEGFKESPSRNALRRELGMAEDRTYMLSAGSVARVKGVDEFYEAFKMLALRRLELAAVWVGGGPAVHQLRNLALKDGLSDRFMVTGHLPRQSVLRFMQAADLMAFPSHAEGLPNVVMEAMAAGLPTVATDVGGTSEVIANEATGLLVPAKNISALADAVERMLEAPQQAQRMALRGRELILKHFDVDRNAPVALSILRHVVSGGPLHLAQPACAGIRVGRLPIDLLSDSPYHSR